MSPIWLDPSEETPSNPRRSFGSGLIILLVAVFLFLGFCDPKSDPAEQRIDAATSMELAPAATGTAAPTTDTIVSVAETTDLAPIPPLAPLTASQGAVRIDVPSGEPETEKAPPGSLCPEWYGPALGAGFVAGDWSRLSAIISKESKCDPFAHNQNSRTGDNSYCGTQLNMLAHAGWMADEGLPTYEALFDMNNCMTSTHALFVKCGGFGPWTKPYTCNYKRALTMSAPVAAKPWTCYTSTGRVVQPSWAYITVRNVWTGCEWSLYIGHKKARGCNWNDYFNGRVCVHAPKFGGGFI